MLDREDLNHLKQVLVPLTVIRKEKAMLPEEWSRLKLDKEAQKLELGTGSSKRYAAKRENLVEALDAGSRTRKPKTPRIGTEGCCGKGCNGCLIFWNDPTYARARELLAQKKQGEMFDKDMQNTGE